MLLTLYLLANWYFKNHISVTWGLYRIILHTTPFFQSWIINFFWVHIEYGWGRGIFKYISHKNFFYSKLLRTWTSRVRHFLSERQNVTLVQSTRCLKFLTKLTASCVCSFESKVYYNHSTQFST